MKYAVLIEQAAGNLSAYVPDLPGCVATGTNTEQVKNNIKSAIKLHIEGLRAQGLTVPAPSTACDYIDAG